MDAPVFQKLEPFPHQPGHIKRCQDILDREGIVLDRSDLGTGKTECAFLHSLHYKKKPLVICQNNMKKEFEHRLNVKYGIANHGVYSYNSIRGTATYQPSSGLLERKGAKVKLTRGKDDEASFEATRKLINMFEEGAIVIIDEAQAVKRASAQSSAIAEIIRVALRYKCKVILLSGTLFDKKAFSVNLLKVIGMIRTNSLTYRNPSTGQTILAGIQEAIDFAKKYDKEETARVVSRFHLGRKGVATQCAYELWIRVVQNAISSAMPGKSVMMLCKNAFRYYPTRDVNLANETIRNLQKAIDYDEVKQTTNLNKDIAETARCLVKIEYSGIQATIDYGRAALEQKHVKLVLFVNYKDCIAKLAEGFKDYRPLLYVGATDPKERPDVLRKFNQPNDDYRVIIISMRIGAEGIEVDDKFGDFVRVGLCPAGYDITKIRQAGGRLNRIDTQSQALFKIIYPINTKALMPVLDAMADKSGVLEQVMVANNGSIPKLPSSFECEVQEKPDGYHYIEANVEVLGYIERQEEKRKLEEETEDIEEP